MVMDKKLPLQSSNNANIGRAKTIEQTYKKKTQLDHILLRPDTYIGSIQKHSQNLWVFESDEMVYKTVSYVPGLYKIFDEILVNAADNKQRDPSMNALRVDIDVEQNSISVYNNGDGIPVEIHQGERVYVPELIFGHLLTSSNYDDNVKKTTGGRNGYGAKLTNIFSTEFVIETSDGKKQYKQVFMNNMGKKSEPVITKCKNGENWTKVTFKPDLAKFNMTHLEKDVVAIMKKRVFDLAGCLGKTVKVDLNGQCLPVKSFLDYVDLYLKPASKSSSASLPRFTQKVNNRWEICVSISEGKFQQVSFVNSISTIKGGTHVEYVTNQIINYVMHIVNMKNNEANLKTHMVKNHLWVFVNALIDNPSFDSQTKETLTTRQSSFGSKCELSHEFLDKVADSEIVDKLLSWAEFKLSQELKKTDGAKRQRLLGIPKLEDANEAGGKNSDKCTLILTEGDSAKALAMSGITVVGRNYYGVFPLRGKLLNVREASHIQIMENAEIQYIKQILGLRHGKVYDSVKSLRYGHLMIMTDQDHDGSHIKGLLINFIHSFWPSLLKIPSFLVEFITPIVKATHRNGNVLPFYTMPEYESWKESLGGGKANGWSIKYYKGLGTSTGKEAMEYFQSLEIHKKDFIWVDERDGDAIDMAFSKKKIEARKTWLRQFEPGTYLDQKEKLIKYSDFVNKELILFSLADLQRSIPSMVDGLKPGQRKILFCAFKRNLVTEIKVAQFSGYVSEHSAYHHGEQSLAATIIGMGQDFVGSNNINLFNPGGQFGTRYQGGKDHASARYIFTNLTTIARFLFPKDDDILLDYLNEDGQRIEPTWYAPVIPLVLVNGAEGIGTGWSTFVPNYNPRDICANIRRLLRGEPMVPMDPWNKGFKGTIEKVATRGGGTTYLVTGIIEQIDETTLRITELPLFKWTQDYKEFLETATFIKDYHEHNDDTTVHFEIIMSEENLRKAKQELLLKKFKLSTSIGTSNMHLFDPKGVIKKYDNPEQILEEFFHLRLQLYGKRKKMLLANLELELLKLGNKVRFINCLVKGEIIVSNRRRADIFLELQQKGFTPFPKTKSIDVVVGATDVQADYEYLLSMGIGTLTFEKIQELCSQQEKLSSEVDELRKSSPETLWINDLDALDQKLDELDIEDTIAEVDRKNMKGKVMNEAGMKASQPAAKNPRKNNTKKPTNPLVEEAAPVSSSMEMGETLKSPPKGRGGAGKAPANKRQKPTVVDIDEDDELLELKDHLAAYNFDSSPDQPAAMKEAGKVPSRKIAPSKMAAAQKQPTTILTVISDDDDHNDEEFGVEVVVTVMKKGGRAAKKTKVVEPIAETRKRGPAKKQLLSQKLITDVLKPVENAGASSPEKKVRKIRPSPFNKKSGSILGRMENKDDEISPMCIEEEDGSGLSASTIPEKGSSEVGATRPRPVENKDNEISPMCIEEEDGSGLSASTIPKRGSSEVVATRPRPVENKDDEISPMCIEEEDSSGLSASTIPEKGSSEVVATRPRPVREQIGV